MWGTASTPSYSFYYIFFLLVYIFLLNEILNVSFHCSDRVYKTNKNYQFAVLCQTGHYQKSESIGNQLKGTMPYIFSLFFLWPCCFGVYPLGNGIYTIINYSGEMWPHLEIQGVDVMMPDKDTCVGYIIVYCTVQWFSLLTMPTHNKFVR